MCAIRRATGSLARTLLLACAVLPAVAAAQGAPAHDATAALRPGARVRITQAGTSTRRVGTLVAVSGDTLVARWAPDDSGRVALADMTRLEVSHGRRRHPWLGAGLGFVTGVVIGAVTSDQSEAEDECGSDELCHAIADPVSTSMDAVAGGAVGALVGVVVGALWRTDAWRPVALGPSRVGLAAPRPGHAARIGVSARF